MRLIGLAVVLTLSLTLASLAVEAQTGKVWRIGLMHVGLDHALGYEDGRNIRLDFRNLADQAAANITAQQLVRDQVDLIVAFEEQAMRGVKAATSAIPVVFLHLVDPVADGFVESLAHPGGNVTGFITWAVSPSKQIELFSEVVPRPRRLMVLVDPKDPVTRRSLPELRNAGATLRIQVVEHEVTTASDIERALGAADRGKVDGVFVLSPTLWTNFPSLVLRLTKERRLPLVSHRKEWVQQGALFSYAPDLAAIGRLAAPYVTKILNGTKPGDLPVHRTAPSYRPFLQAAEAARGKLGVQLRTVGVSTVADYDGAFATLAQDHVDAVLVHASTQTGRDNPRRLTELALKHRLPTIFGNRDNAVAGGLMSYAPDMTDQWRRAAVYIDKILKGAKPADLPVEQASKFELVINLKTAKALRLTIPQTLLQRADELIQ